MSGEAKRLNEIRDLYVRWSGTTNPVLLAAAGQLAKAGGFRLTEAEVAECRARQGHPPFPAASPVTAEANNERTAEDDG